MAKVQSNSDMPDYQCEDDARTLKNHADITSDPKRHAAAHAKLLEQTQSHQSALDSSHKQLRGKVKKGLKKAFPSSTDSKTPFEKAGGD